MTERRLELALIELVQAARESSIDLMLAGGLAVVLRVQRAQLLQRPTLGRSPVARTTLDLDVLLHPAVIVNSAQMERLRTILANLGYEVVPGAEHYQFVRGNAETSVKVDLHVETPPPEAAVKIGDRRVRAHRFRGLHAHRADEAAGSSLHPVAIVVAPSGLVVARPDVSTVEVPTPNLFTFLAMKLMALRDQLEASSLDDARRHAFDMFALWASTDEPAWDHALKVRVATADAPIRAELASAAQALFRHPDSVGRLRAREALRSSGYELRDGDIEAFVEAVIELFT